MAIGSFRKPRTLVDEVAAHLREMILKGTISPGERLSELRFTREFSLSRSPIREAFRMLAAEGLITIAPRRGASVRPISVAELRDIFEVRALFETFALAQAGRQLTAERMQTMRDLLCAARATLAERDVEAWYASSQAFHDAIIEAAGNQALKVLYDYIKLAMRRYQLLVIGLPRHPDRSQAEHDQIFEALVSGDTTRGAALVRAHLDRVADALSAALEQRPRPTARGA